MKSRNDKDSATGQSITFDKHTISNWFRLEKFDFENPHDILEGKYNTILMVGHFCQQRMWIHLRGYRGSDLLDCLLLVSAEATIWPYKSFALTAPLKFNYRLQHLAFGRSNGECGVIFGTIMSSGQWCLRRFGYSTIHFYLFRAEINSIYFTFSVSSDRAHNSHVVTYFLFRKRK